MVMGYECMLTFDSHLDDVNPRWPPNLVLKVYNFLNHRLFSRYRVNSRVYKYVFTTAERGFDVTIVSRGLYNGVNVVLIPFC